jgi:hypothetical protein
MHSYIHINVLKCTTKPAFIINTAQEMTRREVIDVQYNKFCGKTQKYFSVSETDTHYYQWDLKYRIKSVKYIFSCFSQF